MNYQNSKFAIALTAASLISGQAMASHHFESVIVQKTPALNQLDNYVFASPKADHTVFIMTVNSVPKSGPNGIFATDALYNIHVADDDGYKTGHTFSLSFSSDNTFTVYESQTPNGAVGAKGAKIGAGKLGKTSELAKGIKAWAGVVKDPFFGNSTSLGLLRAQLNAGKPYDPSIWAQAQGKSIFLGREASAIVLEVPNSMLGKTIRTFMTTAVDTKGTWKQVQYSANPLLSHIMMFESQALKGEHDQSRPDSENGMKAMVSARVARATTLAKTEKDPQQYGDEIAAKMIPDVLTYKVGSTAHYTLNERNGRSLDDDAMSTVLTMLLGTPTDQKIANPKLHTANFPYLMPAQVK
jgi:hypothetical protein